MTDLTAEVQAAQSAPIYRAEQFVKIVFPDATVRLWTGIGPYRLDDGDQYVGLGFMDAAANRGSLGSISQISETSDLSAQTMELTMAGMPTALMAELRDYAHQGSPVTVKEAQFTSAGTLVPDSYTLFTGIIDTMTFTAGATLVITINCDGMMRMMLRGPDGHRRTQGDQELCFAGSGDLGLEFAGRLKEQVPWDVPDKLVRNGGFGNI